MPRLKPTPQDLRRINLLHQRVQAYFIEQWHNDWSRHGENFTGFENIHVKNAFYEAVESAIEEKYVEKYGSSAGAEMAISKHSVRRFFRNEGEKGYDQKVLNGFLLLIGENDDWENFPERVAISSAPQPAGKNTVKNRNYLYSGGVVMAIIVIASLYYLYQKQYPVITDPIFTAEIAPSEGYPKSIRVHYDFSDYKFETAAILFNDQRINIVKIKGDTTITVFTPNYIPVNLYINDEVVKQIPLLLTSDGWAGSINNRVLAPEESYNKAGVLYFTAFQRMTALYGEYYCSFLNFRDFKVNGENVSLEAEVKNTLADGGIWAFDISVDIIGKKDRIVFNLVNPDAVIFAQLAVAQTNFRHGKRAGKLANLGVDLSDWRKLKVETHDHRIIISLDGKILINDTYEGDIGDVVGLQFYTKGSGWVRNVTLNREKL